MATNTFAQFYFPPGSCDDTGCTGEGERDPGRISPNPQAVQFEIPQLNLGITGTDLSLSDEELEKKSCEAEQEQEQEQEKDREAQEVAEKILKAIKNREANDLPHIEFGTFLVTRNGLTVDLPLISGSGNAIDVSKLYELFRELGIDDGDIIALVHSHPPDGHREGDFRQLFPSDSDIAAFDVFLQNAILFGNATEFGFAEQFSSYVLGPDGILREYDRAAIESLKEIFESLKNEDGEVVVPKPGEDGFDKLKEIADKAEDDAAGKCSDE